MRILIIRHAEPDYSIDSLTKEGFREAEYLGQRLLKESIDDCYCSPLGRAKDTAKPFLEKSGKTAKELLWLKEFSGKTKPRGNNNSTLPWNLEPQFWTKQKELFDKDKWLTNSFMAGGTVKDEYDKVTSSFDKLLLSYDYKRSGYIYKCAKNTDKTIALFCHFALGTLLTAYLTGVSPSVLWQGFFMPPSSVTTFITEEIEKGDVFFKCMQMGDTSHLYANNQPVSHSGLFPEVYGKNYKLSK